MADQTTSYVLQVTDGIASSIEPKLSRIKVAALGVNDAVSTLQQSMGRLNPSNLTTTAQALAGAQRSLSTSTQSYARSAVTAANNTTTYANALPRLTTNATSAANAIQALAIATTAFISGARGVNQAAQGAAAAQNGLAGASNGAVGGTRSLAAGLGLLEGRFTSSNRLAAQFLQTVAGSSGIMQAAFYAGTAVALVAVLGQVATAVYHVVAAYREMSSARRNAELNDITELNGVQRQLDTTAKLFSAATAFKVFNGNFKDIVGPKIDVQDFSALQRNAQAYQTIAAARRADNEAGLQGTALRAQQKRDLEDEYGDLQKIIQGYTAYQKSVRDQLSASHTIEVADGLKGPKQVSVTNIDRDSEAGKALTKQLEAVSTALQQANTEATALGYKIEGAGKKEQLAAVKDDAKAAAQEMRELNTAFDLYVGKLDHKLTPNEGLTWWEHAEKGLKHYSDNIDAVSVKEKQYQQEIASRNDKYTDTVGNLDAQMAQIGAYSDARKEQQQLDRIAQEFQRTGIPLTQAETAALRSKIAVIVESATYQAQLNTEYNDANGPLRTYIASQQALRTLLQDGAISQDKYQRQLAIAQRTYTDATQPLAEYARGLEQQIDLLGQYGTALTVSTQIQQVQQTLRQRGITLTNSETIALQSQLTALQMQREINAQQADIYSQNTGAEQRTTTAIIANQRALASGAETAATYAKNIREITTAASELSLERGLGTFADSVNVIFGNLTKGYTTFSAGATKALGGFFTQLSDGFADTVGHVIAYGGNLKSSLLDVARSGVGELISSFIKLGLQWVLTTTLGTALSAAATTTASTQAAALATAWAPAAIGASIATLGAADALGSAAYATSVAAGATIAGATSAATGAAHLAGGGPVYGPGTSTSDSIPARLSHGEFVINAAATARHFDDLVAINSGRTPAFAAGGYVAGVRMAEFAGQQRNTGAPKLVIEDHTSGVKFVPVGTSDDQIRVIARQVVATDTDKVVGRHMADRNSATRRGLQQHTNTRAIS